MRSFKKKFIVLAFLLALGAGKGTGLFAQGYPVLDVANLMQAIETVYQYYQQVQNTIEQVQNTYRQIEQAAEQVKEINFDDLSSLGNNFDGVKDNPFELITATRNSAQDITRVVNQQMNLVNELQDSLTNEQIKIGNKYYSAADLAGAGGEGKGLFGATKSAWEWTKEQCHEAAKGYEGELTYAEKQAIARQYGMSARNYATLELANTELKNGVNNAIILGTKEAQKRRLEEIEANDAVMKKIAENSPNNSMYAAAQMTNSSLGVLNRMVGRFYNSMANTAGMLANHFKDEEAREQIKTMEQRDKEKLEKKGINTKGLDIDASSLM